MSEEETEQMPVEAEADEAASQNSAQESELEGSSKNDKTEPDTIHFNGGN